jgi:hypothetical protein
MSLWAIGNLLLLVAVVPILVGLLNRVLAALELLATTDTVIDEVAVGAVRYAGSVGKLLG